MDWLEYLARRVGKEVFLRAVAYEIDEFVVAPVYHAAAYQTPLRNSYPFFGLVHTVVAQRVAYYYVLAQQIANALDALGFDRVFEKDRKSVV